MYQCQVEECINLLQKHNTGKIKKLFEDTWGNINISDSRMLATCMRNEITETSVGTRTDTYEENVLSWQNVSNLHGKLDK
jgi:hypothetical protein